MRWTTRLVISIALAWTVASFTALVVLRFVDPSTSMVIFLAGDDAQVGTWLTLEEIPDHQVMAVLASEDQRFFLHSGVDFDAVKTAVDQARRGQRLRGASTLTQQCVKNLFLSHKRSWLRKAVEAVLALQMDLVWPKSRILEVYLNIAEFGPDVYGVEAGAHYHFGKPAGALTPSQSALMASVLPSPKTYSLSPPDTHVAERARWIAVQIRQLGGAAMLSALDE